MKKIISFCLGLSLSFLSFFSVSETNVLSLMPYPQSVESMVGKHLLTNKVMLVIQGMSHERHQFVQQQLSELLERNDRQIVSDPFLKEATMSIINIVVNQRKTTNFLLPRLKQDESYQLKINEHGIEVVAENDFGAMQGVATLKQLISSHTSKNIITLPQILINDFPRFPWRGLMIDSVRHFISVEAIKRQIDGMSAAKLNVFHWHLTDDQGWRFESKSYPKLHQQAADGQYYTQQEISEVVEYANLLGIRVVPEFDVPGHASAIAVAYPELITEQKSVNEQYLMEDSWGVFEPLLDPSNPDVYMFIDKLVAELTTLFPDEYMHIGGDEVNPTQWENSEKIQQYMLENNLKDSHALQVNFNEKVQLILTKHQRKMMGWDEIYHPDLPKNIMVQSWRGMESLSKIAADNYQGLLSTGFYIDQSQRTAYHYRNDPLATKVNNVVELTEEDNLSAWQFMMPRLKGSAVKGTLVLIERNKYLIHAYVKLNNNHYKKVRLDRHLALNQQQINFMIDSWMGPTRGEFDLSDPSVLSGRMLIGNTHYDIQGKQLNEFDFSTVKLLPNLLPEFEANILGGEATLWSELVTENNIDLRIWPRTFAIAERLWSSQSVNNINDMYRRLTNINVFAASIGLQHLQQQIDGIRGLVFPNTDITPLMMLAEQLEPASYYTRHHLKFQQGLYHQNASLNWFADYLPVESLGLVNMNQQLEMFKNGDKSGLQSIVNTMRRWHYNYADAVKLINKNPKLSTLHQVVDEARKVNTIGLTIAQSCLSGVKIRNAEVKRVKKTLFEIQKNVREISIASGLFIEKVLEVCRK